MATPDKRMMIYPSPKSLAILGKRSPDLNRAVDCWAEQIRRATAENAALLERREWMLLSDILNGTATDPSWTGELLAQEIEDAHSLDGAGDKWFGPGEGKQHTAALAEKLRGLDYGRAWAVILSVLYFWEHRETINAETDDWWTLPFRLRRAEADA